MRVCPNCKTSNFDVDTKCTKCGCPLRLNPSEKVIAFPQNSADENTVFVKTKVNETNGLKRVAKAFMIVSCVCYAVYFVLILAMWIFSIALYNSTEIFEFEIGAITSLLVMILYLPRVIIPICMTNSYSYKIASGKNVGVGFKIATLLFVSVISGILMLCDNDN